jgi:hypothetical protein
MRASVLTLAVLLGVALAPATALAANNAAATKTYLRADNLLVTRARAKLATSEATLGTLLHQVQRECPGVAAESPQDVDSEQLSNELVGVMTVVSFRPDDAAIASFVKSVAPLQWSNAALTRTVREYARKLTAQAALAAPDLCGDVRAWVSSGYRTLPAATERFDQSFFALDVAIGELPTKLLAPYVSPGDRGLVQRTHQIELQLIDGEARAVPPYGRIMEALALNP